MGCRRQWRWSGAAAAVVEAKVHVTDFGREEVAAGRNCVVELAAPDDSLKQPSRSHLLVVLMKLN